MADTDLTPVARNLAVYIVFGIPREKVNDRTKKLLRLRQQFSKMVLVTPGKRSRADDRNLEVKPILNPTGLLRLLGLAKLAKAVDRYLFFPSPHNLFVLPARRKLLRLITNDLDEGKKVCLLTCAPPHGTGLIGLYIKKKYPQVHWIIDWQDLWSYDENYYYKTPQAYRNKLKACEQKMLATADMNVTTNAYAQAVLEQQYNVPHERTCFIHHHFDREDIPAALDSLQANTNEADTIKLGFLGSLFKPPRVPGGDLVEALAQVRAKGRNVELHVHGPLPPGYEQSKQRLFDAGVILHGPSSHEEAVQQLAKYDFLLLLLADLPNCSVVMSIKLPHYLMMGKPILAIVPERSAIAEIVKETGAGIIIPASSNWKRELGEIFTMGILDDGIPQRNKDVISQFEWAKISAQWCELLKSHESQIEKPEAHIMRSIQASSLLRGHHRGKQ